MTYALATLFTIAAIAATVSLTDSLLRGVRRYRELIGETA